MIRLKHILLPICAAMMLGSYSIFANVQAAKFDSELWKNTDQYREQMLGPLMGYVLKVGQTREEVREKLGFPVEEMSYGCCYSFWEYGSAAYRDKYETGTRDSLVVIYSIHGKVTDFYVGDRSHNFIF